MSHYTSVVVTMYTIMCAGEQQGWPPYSSLQFPTAYIHTRLLSNVYGQALILVIENTRKKVFGCHFKKSS